MRIVLFLVFLSASFVHAQSREGGVRGGGGDGVLKANKVYSLDLVEVGMELDPFFDSSVPVDFMILTRLQNKLSANLFPVPLLARKISEVQKADPLFALLLLKAIEFYNWRIVDGSLIDIKDEDSLLDIPRKDLVQIASRSNSSVLIDRNIWPKMADDKNRVALMLHEVIYAMVKPQWAIDPKTGQHSRDPKTGLFTRHQFQSSPRAREVTGYLFTPELKSQGRKGLTNFLSTQHDFEWGYAPLIVREAIADDRFFINPLQFFSAPTSGFRDPRTEPKFPSYGSGPSEAAAYAKAVCSLVVDVNAPLFWKVGEDSYRISLSSYGTPVGEKFFLKIERDLSFVKPYEVLYSDKISCEKAVENITVQRLEYYNSNYRKVEAGL